MRFVLLALALVACTEEPKTIIRDKDSPNPSGTANLHEHILLQGGADGFIEVTLTLEHGGEKAVVAEYPHFSGANPRWEGETNLFLCADGEPTRMVKHVTLKGVAFEISERCESW